MGVCHPSMPGVTRVINLSPERCSLIGKLGHVFLFHFDWLGVRQQRQEEYKFNKTGYFHTKESS